MYKIWFINIPNITAGYGSLKHVWNVITSSITFTNLCSLKYRCRDGKNTSYVSIYGYVSLVFGIVTA